MIKKLCILLVITTISLAAVAGTTNKKAQKYYEKAMSIAEKGDLAKAEKKMLQVIESDPNFFEAYLELGKIYQKQGKVIEAEKNYEKALALDAKGAQEVYDIIFDLAVKQNDVEKQTKWAVSKLEAYKENATDSDAHNVVVVAFAKANSGDLIASQELFSKVRNFKPNFLEGYFFSGILYLKNNKKKEASEIFQEAVDKNIANDDTLNILSLLYYKDLKDNEKAKKIYNIIISNESSKYRRDALVDMINIYIDEKNNEEALNLCNHFIEDFPTDALLSVINKNSEKLKHNIEVEKQKK